MSALTDALARLHRDMGQIDGETLRYAYGPSAPIVEELEAAVAAAEEEREALLAALSDTRRTLADCGYVDGHPTMARAAVAIARARGAAEAQHEPAMIFVGDGAARCPRCGTEYVGTTTGYVIDRCICGERIAAEAQAP